MPDRRPGWLIGHSGKAAEGLCPHWKMGRGILPRRDATMALTTRLHHDIDMAQRATLTMLADLVLAAFVALALGVTVYDIGKWLAIW